MADSNKEEFANGGARGCVAGVCLRRQMPGCAVVHERASEYAPVSERPSVPTHDADI